ncbi:MAG TPA: CoA activase, partial [Clostridia bacterium]|nr:CoA activase [Clostridia bacterium]
CRLGVYHLLSRIVLDRLGWRDRVRIWSPRDDDYFAGLPGGTEIIVFAGVIASDLLAQARLDVRPHERVSGETDAWYQRWQRELLELVETAAREHGKLGPALWHATSGRLFGLPKLLDRAGAELAALRGPGHRPVVELTGEIYLRAVDFSNDFIVEKLEARGLQVRLAPMSEWLAYCNHLNRQARGADSVASRVNHFVQHRIEGALFGALGRHLGWPVPPGTADVLEVASRYVNPALLGEAVLTVGASLHAWRRSHIDAVINIGPLECMPSKIAEAQFHPVATHEGLLSLSLAFDGNPINTTTLDNFAFEVHARWQHRRAEKPPKEATLHS